MNRNKTKVFEIMNEQKETGVAVADSKEEVNGNIVHQQQNVNSINAINLLDPDQIAKAEVFLSRLIKTDKGGIKTVQDGLAIIMRAQDLNLPFSTCLEHIHVISGKTGVDIHVIKALLSRAGITWVCDNDYVPLYEYTDGINVYSDALIPDYCIRCKGKEDAEKVTDNNHIGIYPVKNYMDFNGNVYKDYQMNDKFAVVISKQQAAAVVKEGKFPVYRVPNVPVDYITEYTLTRRRIIGGKEVITTSHSKFSYSDALKANLFVKDTYKLYARTLIGHRAFTYGARDIASDILFGIMETTELKIMSGIDLNDRDIVEIQATEID